MEFVFQTNYLCSSSDMVILLTVCWYCCRSPQPELNHQSLVVLKTSPHQRLKKILRPTNLHVWALRKRFLKMVWKNQTHQIQQRSPRESHSPDCHHRKQVCSMTHQAHHLQGSQRTQSQLQVVLKRHSQLQGSYKELRWSQTPFRVRSKLELILMNRLQSSETRGDQTNWFDMDGVPRRCIILCLSTRVTCDLYYAMWYTPVSFSWSWACTLLI